MSRISMNKSSLQKERVKLKLYQRLLPSLELKRMQLLGEQRKAERALGTLHQQEREALALVGAQLPMLANKAIAVAGLVKIKDVRLGQENVVGVVLPKLEEVAFFVYPYSMLAKPHWVDRLVKEMKIMLDLRARLQVMARRVNLLAQAVKRITQRVNLFKKVLIPQTETTIARIRIFLGDAERAAVVRSKIAKQMHERSRPSWSS